MQNKKAVLMLLLWLHRGYRTNQFESKCQQVLVPLSLPNTYPVSVSSQLHSLSLLLMRTIIRFLKAAINT